MSGSDTIDTGMSVAERMKLLKQAFNGLQPVGQSQARTEVQGITGTVQSGKDGLAKAQAQTTAPSVSPGTEDARSVKGPSVEERSGGAHAADAIAKRLASVGGDINAVKTEAAKPMILKGVCSGIELNFAWLEAELKKLPAGPIPLSKHTKEAQTGEFERLKREFATARTGAAGRSAAGLAKIADDHAKKAAERTKEGEAPTDSKKLFKDANADLTALMNDLNDWEAQVKEATAWLAGDAGAFTAPLQKLEEARVALETVIGKCLPKLTAKIGKAPVVPTGGGTTGTEEVEPGIPSGGELQALRDCKGWAGAKQTWGPRVDEMKKLQAYRKKLVDDMLNKKLNPYGMKEGPSTGWVSVGSTDPTSDYDISVNKHGKKDEETFFDYQVVKWFNEEFRSTYRHGIRHAVRYQPVRVGAADVAVAE